MSEKVKPIIKIRQGDASNFTGHAIIFKLITDDDITGYSAKFQLQDIIWEFPDVSSKRIELTITAEQSASLEVGHHIGWLKIIDAAGLPGTLHAQPFLIEARRVF